MADDFRLGDWLIQPALNLATRNGKNVHLRPKVMNLLVLLVSEPQHVLSKNLILEKLWATEYVSESALTSVVAELRQALADDAERPWLLETIPKRGYRLIAAVRPPVPDTEPVLVGHDPAMLLDGYQHEVHGARRRPLMLFLGLLAVATAAALWIGSGASRPDGRRSTIGQIRAVAVLPFRDLSRNTADRWLPDAITDGLISELGQLDGLERLIGHESAMHYRDSSLSIRQIGEELHVQAIVSGTVAQEGDRLRISAELIDVGTERQLWTETYPRDTRDLADVQRQVVRDIVREVRIKLTPRQRRRLNATQRRGDPGALELLRKAREASRQIKYRDAVRYLQLALALDPDLAPGWAELAQTLVFQAYGSPQSMVIPRAQAAADRALALDPENGQARAALGRIRLHVDWDWDGAGRYLAEAVALSPRDPNVRWQYGFYLGVMGRLDESVRETRASLQLEPMSPYAHFQLGFALRVARQYDAAVDAMSHAVDLAPDVTFFRAQRGYTRALKGDCDAALVDLRTAGPSAFDGYVAAICGSPQRARADADAANHSGRCRADIDVALERLDAAFACLDRQFAARDFALAQVPSQPAFLALHSDPRFDRLMRRMGYPR